MFQLLGHLLATLSLSLAHAGHSDGAQGAGDDGGRITFCERMLAPPEPATFQHSGIRSLEFT